MAVNMAAGANMKRMLVVNDMYGGENRILYRESILSEFNRLNRFFNEQLDRLCLNSGKKE